MNTFPKYDRGIKICRFFYRKISGKKFMDPECVLDREKANDIIYRALSADKPLMISRIGSGEMNCIMNTLVVKSPGNKFRKIWNYITDKTELPWWDRTLLNSLSNNMGVFPANFDILRRFSELYLEYIHLIDVLGSFNYLEKYLPFPDNMIRIHLETMYPFFVKNPWTRALAGKRVLVVHPFVDTIRRQYEKRHLLFNNPEILPEYELLTIKAVQSACGEKTQFKDWFEALDYMKEQISAVDFDVCILGCGAYGLPLAAHVKRLGKKAIHMGGGSQLLWGIKGKRWEENYVWTYKTPKALNLNYKDLFNDYWVRPNRSETPSHAVRVESACYW